MSSPREPRVLFVGGSGHHYLRRAVTDPTRGLFVADPDAPGAAEAMAERGGFAMFDGSLASAVDDFAPDIVSVGTVYGKAGEHVLAARQLGLPVVTDKPAAATWEQLAALEAREAIGGPILTEFDWRAQPALRAAKKLVESGDFGPIVLALAQKTYPLGNRPTWYRNRDLYGGTMLWVASHAIDALRFVCGELTVVSAHHSNAGSPSIAPAEDIAVANFTLASGGIAVAHADLARPTGHGTHGDDRLVVRCAKGEIEVRGGECIVTKAEAPKSVPLPSTPSLEHSLIAAALGESDDDAFSTDETLLTSRLLLQARDAADGEA